MTSTFYGLNDSDPKPMQEAALTSKMDAAIPKRTAQAQAVKPASQVKVR